MADVTISARIPAELKGDLTALATALKRSPSSLVEEALRGYIEAERQFLEAVEEGIRDYEAGNVVEHAAVVEQMEARRRRVLGGE